MAAVEERAAETFLGGRVRARQTAKGYRAAVDTVLLGASIDAGPGETLVELGCGPGTAMLIAAVQNPGAVFDGVEIDPAAVALAAVNADLSGLADRVTARVGDVADPPARRYDQAFFNPPYYDDATALRPPADPDRRRAFVGVAGGLKRWLDSAVKAVKPRGLVTVVHRADRLGDILDGLAARAGDVRVRPVHAFADTAAKRVLVRARVGAKSPLLLLPPLVLHEAAGGWTARAKAIQDGRARIAWDA